MISNIKRGVQADSEQRQVTHRLHQCLLQDLSLIDSLRQATLPHRPHMEPERRRRMFTGPAANPIWRRNS